LTRAPGRVTDAQLRWLYANAAALVATSNEDFGLTPVEAFGFGTPVVALRAGGYLDSCVDGVTGVWVEDPSVGGVGDGLRRFRSAAFDRDTIIAHGAQWSPQRFAGRLAALINEVL
jgi:glycosyltransferase involved in cell wall biosynthesis